MNHLATDRREMVPIGIVRGSGRVRRRVGQQVLVQGGYRPYLDGIRAVAIVLVLLEHTFGPLPLDFGGTGVGLFFGLSGYLITGLLLDEWHRRGAVSLRDFYIRRGARLLPALFAMVTVCDLAFLTIHDTNAILASFTALTYTSNYVTILVGGWLMGYGQMWSLAVEEHFYLLWPIALIAVVRRWGVRGVLRLALALSCVALFLRLIELSLLHMPERLLYVGSVERMDALLLGAAAAAAFRLEWRPRWWVVPVALGLLSLSLLKAGTPFVVLSSTFCGIGSASLCIGLDSGRVRPLRRALSWPPLVHFGLISYGVYLWHYPLMHLTDHVGWGFGGRGVAVVLSVLIAASSYRYFEAPIRQWARHRWSSRPRDHAADVVDVREASESVPAPRSSGSGATTGAAPRPRLHSPD